MTVNNKEIWYLQLFSVNYPTRPSSVRVVFDSAKYQGHSHNDVLLQGHPLYSSLHGILLSFRREAVAVTADVEQMFHNFLVAFEHRYYIKFLWHEDNDLSKPRIDYNMNVMCFGTAHRLLWPPMGSARQLRKTSHMSRTLFLGKPLCRWWTSFLSNSSRSCWATRPKTTRHIHFQRVTWLKISAIWFFAMTRYLCNEAWGSLGHRNWSVHVFYL